MSASTVDVDLVAGICRAATAGSGSGIVVDVVRDPLDDTAWVRMSSWPAARQALTALHSYGVSGHDLEDGRLHVTGWDVRLLHRRLGVLLAGVDDLKAEWDATAELVCYHHDRRVAAGVDPDPAEVLADVETVMRSCLPIPHRAPRVQDVDSLLQLIAAAEDAYQQLIAEHLDYAERVLADHIACRSREGAA
jgi:hypothetical protein